MDWILIAVLIIVPLAAWVLIVIGRSGAVDSTKANAAIGDSIKSVGRKIANGFGWLLEKGAKLISKKGP